MPYKRVGKCVYKKLTNGKLSKDPVGCSDSIEDAKEYLKALYASEMKENLNEELSPEIQQKAKIIFKAIVNSRGNELFQKMGSEAESYIYGTAINQAKRSINKQNKEMTSDENLKEMVKNALSKPTYESIEDTDEVIDFKKYSKSQDLFEDDWEQKDDESDMAKSQLSSIINTAQSLENLIQNDEQLDAWVQAKLTKAQDYLNSINQYIEGEKKQKNTKSPIVIDLTQKVIERLKTKM
jgi:hypothetical protein